MLTIHTLVAKGKYQCTRPSGFNILSVIVHINICLGKKSTVRAFMFLTGVEFTWNKGMRVDLRLESIMFCPGTMGERSSLKISEGLIEHGLI